MSRYSYPLSHSDPDFLGEMSRRKLQKVAESSDTLRRSVLILNVMRSTASIYQKLPSASDDSADNHHTHRYQREDHVYDDEEEEQAYREAASRRVGEPTADVRVAYGAIESSHLIVSSPSKMTYSPSPSSGEQDWLDSILDDLQEDVHVSVVDAEQDEYESSDPSATTTSECWHPPLFPAPQCTPPAPSSSPPPTLSTSPPLRPISPRYIPIPDVLFADEDDMLDSDPQSPPASPPGLDADEIDSDSDEDYGFGCLMDSDDFSDEATTPSASVEFPQAVTSSVPRPLSPSPVDSILFSHLPFNRLRPITCYSHRELSPQ